MNQSCRSTHANAFLAGVGRRRRIVLFDTLLATLGPEEVEAVLAHELGHVRHRHVAGRLLAGGAVSLAGFALLGQLLRTPSFFHGLGVERVSTHTGIFLFLSLVPLLTIPLRPLALAWYLPLLVLTIFRPNLEDRLATSVVT